MAASLITSGSLSSRRGTNRLMILVSVARKVLAKFPIDLMLGIRRVFVLPALNARACKRNLALPRYLGAVGGIGPFGLLALALATTSLGKLPCGAKLDDFMANVSVTTLCICFPIRLLNGDGVFVVFLNGFKGEMANYPGHHDLNLHMPFFENFRKHLADTRIHDMFYAFRIPAEQPYSSRRVLLPFQSPIFRELQELRHAAFLDD
nr:hypothetical protein PanWU01x14_201600 [Ipomoea batatas]